MKIKKLGHSCLVIETNSKKILIDPGKYSTLQNEEKNIDLILITHEHQDHFDLESVKKIIENNSRVLIITNGAVGKLLDTAGIKYKKLENGQSDTIAGVQIESYGNQHAFMRSGIQPPQNTGYFVAGKLFYPGDAFTNPDKPVEVLALPVAAPWLKIDEVIKYIKAINPKLVFPVHDGMYNQFGLAYVKRILSEILDPLNIHYIIPEIGKTEEF